MKVFKFGGASIKDSEAVKNMSKVIDKYSDVPLLIVVSAMAKNTNLLEEIINLKLKGLDYESLVLEFETFHRNICSELFNDPTGVERTIDKYFDELRNDLSQDLEHRRLYDAIVIYGELLSSTIVSEYIEDSVWLDARDCVKTDDHYQNANINWKESKKRIISRFKDFTNTVVTQGFIGSDSSGNSTTLGREGSDFSAAIFATCLEAESVTVWKDVPGILNGDPKRIQDTQKFDQLPYKEAAEMTYYGASVIHPKTIKPLANSNIPLLVRSFADLQQEGTIIHDCDFKPLPTVIIKDNQCLISFKVLDYSFVNEHNLSVIFKELAAADIQINIMQNSAVSFSIVVDNDLGKVDGLVEKLKDDFQIRYNSGLQLLTIKNYTQELIKKYQQEKKILLEQTSRNNYRSLMTPD